MAHNISSTQCRAVLLPIHEAVSSTRETRRGSLCQSLGCPGVAGGLSGLLTRHEGFSGQVQGWSVQAAALTHPIVRFKDLALCVCPRKPGPLKGPQQLNAKRRVCQRRMRAGVRRGRDAWPMPPGEGEEQAAAAWPRGRHAAACLAAASPGCLVLAEISSSVIPAFSCRDFLN